jgi:Uma2 family endonuclease
MPASVLSGALTTGDLMDRAEFLRRWDALPEINKAELIEGIVIVPSPLSREHGKRDKTIIWWLTQYAYATAGCESGNNVTWFMLDSAPQPDAFLRILPEWGGQSKNGEREAKTFPAGAPELASEISLTSTEIDFGRKQVLYQRAGVQEYITVADFERSLIWRVLEQGSYMALPPDEDGIIRSRVFPGLWLDVEAFWQDDGPKMWATLQAGLATPAHAEFVARLQNSRLPLV